MSGSTGSFGSNANRGTRAPQNTGKEKEERVRREKGSVSEFLEKISPENWVDIVCCTLIAVFLIAIACNWQEFSEWLFRGILFPVIYVGSRIVAFVTAVAAVIGAFVLWLRSRRRRRWFM